MKFQEYLDQTLKNAETERRVLDELSQLADSQGELDAIHIRAAKSSLQVVIENAIGKAKRIFDLQLHGLFMHQQGRVEAAERL